MEDILTVIGVTKSFEGVKVVDNLSFSLRSGHILGFLGPNGAGKSTTLNIISTLLQNDEGKIYYDGVEIEKCKAKFKKEIGVVPQSLAIYEDLTAYQNLKFFAELYGVPRDNIKNVCESALKFVKLEDVRNKKPQTFSGGMKRRLNIACSLVNSPRLIILDEPTVGIDPQSRNFILEAIKKLRHKGVSIIYTTHYMEEIEAIADDVIIIDHGKKIVDNTLKNLHETYSKQSFIVIKTNKFNNTLREKISEISGVESILFDEKNMEFRIKTNISSELLKVIVEKIIQSDCLLLSINSMTLNLEDIFLILTGKKLRD